MNEKAIQDAYNLFAESGYNKSIDDFKSLIKTNPNALNDSYELFKGKGYNKDIESYKSLVGVSQPEKKNSVSTGILPQEVSATKPQTQTTTLDGGDKEKPKPTVSSGGEKPKSYKDKNGQEIIYVNTDPKRGSIDEIPKDIPKGYSYKVIGNSEELKRWKEQKSKSKDFDFTAGELKIYKGGLPEITDPINKNKQIANQAFDYANKNASEDAAIKRLEDEENTNQFGDKVVQGLKNVYNFGIGMTLSGVNELLGGSKDFFTLKKSTPLEVELIQAEKDLIKEGIEPTEGLIRQRAREIFIDNDVLEQKHKLIDQALPSGYDREGVWKELKLEALSSNEKLRGAVASAEIWSGKIKEYKDFVSKVDKDGDSVFDSNVTDQDIATYERLTNEATEAQKNLLKMSKNFQGYLDKANTDEEKLELFKYNYNDWEKSLSNIIGGTKDIVAGSVKLGIKTLFSEGPEGQPSLVRDISEISDEILSETEKERKQFFRYKATSLRSFGDIASFANQLGSEQLPIVGSIILGGNVGVVLTSMSSGGQKIKELEDQAKQPGGIAYSEGKKLLAGWLYAGAEFIPEKLGTQRIIKDLTKTISSASTLSRRTISRDMFKDLPKSFARPIVYSQLEGSTEYLTAEGQIAVDKNLLDIAMTRSEENERRKESYLSGSFMGFGMSGVGGAIAFSVAQAKLYSDSKSVKEVSGLMNKINQLSSEIDSNPNLTKEEVTLLYTEMNKLNNRAFNIVSANAKKGANLSVEAKSFLIDIDIRQSELKDEASNLPSSNFSKDYKDKRIEDIKAEFDTLEDKRQEVIGGGFNALMPLSEIEKKILKDNASKELLKEANERGETEIKITDEQITKRAIENYEKQSKETTVKEPTKEGPTGEQEVKPTATAEGKQAEVLQETKDNVEGLRQQELVEFREQVENAEDFITDGKIDAKKVAKSDNAKAKEIYAKYDAQIKPLLDNIKTQEDAIQEQSTDEGVLRQGQPEVGLQEVVEGDQKPEEVTEKVKSEEEVESIFDLDKDSDLKDEGVLDKAIKFLDDIDKGLTTFRRENISSVLIPAPAVQVAVKAMREALKTAKNIGELIQAGVDALKGTDWYQKLDKKTKKSIEGELATSLSQYAFKEQQRKAIRDENKKIESKLKSNRKSAIANIKAGKFGSLTNTSKSDKSTIVEHETMKVKVLNFSMLLPDIVKKSVSSDLFKKYSNALNALSGRGLATDPKVTAQEVADLYDQIIDDYTNFAEIQNAVTNEDLSVLTDEQKQFHKDNEDKFKEPRKVTQKDESEAEEKREELEDEVMSLVPSIFARIKDYDLNSMSFNILKLFSNVNRSDLKIMTNAQLENFRRVMAAVSIGEDIPSYANEVYKEIIANRNKAITHGVNQRQNVTGVRKFKAARAFLSTFDGIKGLFGDKLKTSIQSRTSRYPRTSIDAANKIFGAMPKFEDAVNEDYKAIPIYNYILSNIVKAEGLWKTREEAVVEKFQAAYDKLFKSSKDIDESFRKIHFAFLQLQAWGNPGNKKVKNGVVSFSENFLNQDTPYGDKDKAKYKAFVEKYKGYQFVRSSATGEVLVFDENNNDVTNKYFSKAEMEAYKTIRAELDNQKQHAEEASLFHNNNALPFVNEYFPENNFSKKASAQKIGDDPLSQRFNSNTSVKSKNLEEKTGVAHPVFHNPFAAALNSIKGTELQYQLLNPIQISRMTLEGIRNDIDRQNRAGNGDSRTAELDKVYQNIASAVDKLTKQIVNSNIGDADALDKVSDFFISKFYTAALASVTRTVADMTLNYAHLAISEPTALKEGFDIRAEISKYIKKNNIKKPDDFYRDMLAKLGSSEINRMLSVVNTTSTRAEFQQEGASADLTRKGVESDISKASKKVVSPLKPLGKLFKSINESLISVSDNMPVLNFWLGNFSTEFKKATGEDLDFEKVSKGDVNYLLKNDEAIVFASMISNNKLNAYLGSKNISAKSEVVVEAMRGQKGNSVLVKMYYKGEYLFRQFIMGSTEQFLKAYNNLYEAEDMGDIEKNTRIMIGNAGRTALYSAATSIMLGYMAGILLGDDDDEEIIRDNSDELSDDNEFIKKLFTVVDKGPQFEEELKESDLTDSAKLDELNKKLLSIRGELVEMTKDKRFNDLFEANYRFLSRQTLERKVASYAMAYDYKDYSIEGIDNVVKAISDGKNISPDNLLLTLGFLYSKKGYDMTTEDYRNNVVDAIEKKLESDSYYLFQENQIAQNIDTKTMEGSFKLAALYQTAENLLKHRNDSLINNMERGFAETGINIAAGVRGNTKVKAVSYLYELLNKWYKEETRGFYDFEKDRVVFSTPDIFLSDKKPNVGKIVESILAPVEQMYILKIIQNKKATDAAILVFGMPFLTDVNRVAGKANRDEVYNNTSGKFKENVVLDYMNSTLYKTKEEKEKEEKEKRTYRSTLKQDRDTTSKAKRSRFE
jgi:hypothetical protein